MRWEMESQEDVWGHGTVFEGLTQALLPGPFTTAPQLGPFTIREASGHTAEPGTCRPLRSRRGGL